jgi:hypothetical protein
MGLVGLIPGASEVIETQLDRVLLQLQSKATDLDRFVHLMNLGETNQTLFYRTFDVRSGPFPRDRLRSGVRDGRGIERGRGSTAGRKAPPFHCLTKWHMPFSFIAKRPPRSPRYQHPAELALPMPIFGADELEETGNGKRRSPFGCASLGRPPGGRSWPTPRRLPSSTTRRTASS